MKNLKYLLLVGLLVIASLELTYAHIESSSNQNKIESSSNDASNDEEEQSEEAPLPEAKTVNQCKGDCTIDWQDCVTICGNNGTQKCYVTCQQKVKKCLDECPNVICHDHCSIDLESCQRTYKNSTVCEPGYNSCQDTCDNAYIGRVDL